MRRLPANFEDRRQRAPGGIAAFSLVELLTVMAIGLAMTAMSGVALKGLKESGQFSNALTNISTALELARSSAVANNMYVYVGIAEYDQTVASTAAQQRAGIGRVVLAVVARKDGTSGIDTTDGSAWKAQYNNGGQLMLLTKPMVFDGVHLADSVGAGSPGMERPAVASNYSVSHSQFTSATPFSYPLGSALESGCYQFHRVIQFDPRGSVRMVTSASSGVLAPQFEIALQHCDGTRLPEVSVGNGQVAAIQIGGINGDVHLYRP